MDQVLDWVISMKSVIWSIILISGVVIGLSILSRVLQRSSTEMSGRRFRNQLIMSGALFCGLIIVILALPIGTTRSGQLITLIGFIISAGIALSSSTILGNAMAGIMLKTVRNFRSGDFIEVETYFGRVTERGLFHTEIQTADRDLVTMPNMFLATNPVKVVRTSGTVISATVSLGYDVPQARIKELLLKAAEGVGLKEPFVQVLELGDFSVVYRVAGLLEETTKLLTYRSRLKAAMLDELHGGKVEIVSPDFMNVRDFDLKSSFIPAPVRAPREKTTDAAPVEVIFDKAEVAASLSALEQDLAAIEAELKEARQSVKDSGDEDTKKKAESRVAGLETRLEKLNAEIVKTREKEDGHKD